MEFFISSVLMFVGYDYMYNRALNENDKQKTPNEPLKFDSNTDHILHLSFDAWKGPLNWSYIKTHVNEYAKLRIRDFKYELAICEEKKKKIENDCASTIDHLNDVISSLEKEIKDLEKMIIVETDDDTVSDKKI